MPRPFCALPVLLFLSLISVPAHAEKNLRRPPGTTRYAAMLQQLRALQNYDKSHANRMMLSSLGRSVKGRSLWLVTLSAHPAPATVDGERAATYPAASGDPPGAGGRGGASSPDSSPLPTGEGGEPQRAGRGSYVAGAGGPKRILYLCRQHGHEPASTEGALAFINALVKADEDTPLAGYLKQATVMVVPMANPDGAEAFLRHNAHDVDLNRDWLRRTQPETRALYSAIFRLHPDLMTDQHELYPNDPRPDFTEAAETGSGASAVVVAACDDAQAVVQGAMRAEGFPIVSHWITDTHPARLAHRYGSVIAGVPTILFETNRLNGSGRTVAARAAAHEQFMLTILRDEAGDRDRLLAEAAAWRAAHPRETQVLASRHQLVPRFVAVPPVPMPPPSQTPSTETPPEKGTE